MLAPTMPRVSGVLAVGGVLPDRTFLPPEALERGTAVHAYTEYFDQGILDESEVDPIVKPYLDGWKNARRYAGFEILGIEEAIENASLLYKGRLDRRVRLGGRLGVLEIKCGKPYSWHRLQLSGYCLGLGPEYQDRWAVYLSPDYPLGFRMETYADRLDFMAFQGMVSAYHWKMANGLEDEILEAVAEIAFGGERDNDPFSVA